MQVTPELIKKAGQLLEDEHVKRVGLEKKAALHEKAIELAYRQVEMGICPPFKSYEEYSEKVASLLGKDLRVVEEAMEMGLGESVKVGKLDTETSGRKTSDERINDFVLTGELS